jgi:formylglycine-generating enzyme required for sulfatase activity
MIFVPQGQFQRDTNPENISRVSSFKISSTEITRWQYKEIMGIDPSCKDSSTSENDPVTMVNWYQIITFCNKLSIKEGKEAVYQVIGIDNWETLTYNSIPKSAIKTGIEVIL